MLDASYKFDAYQSIAMQHPALVWSEMSDGLKIFLSEFKTERS
jgi:hypothetical protein